MPDTLTIYARSGSSATAAQGSLDKSIANLYNYFVIEGSQTAAYVYLDDVATAITKGQKYAISDFTFTSRIGCGVTAGSRTGQMTFSMS